MAIPFPSRRRVLSLAVSALAVALLLLDQAVITDLMDSALEAVADMNDFEESKEEYDGDLSVYLISNYVDLFTVDQLFLYNFYMANIERNLTNLIIDEYL